jgi:hypothetical protein
MAGRARKAQAEPAAQIGGLVAIEGLIPYEANSRTHSEAQVDQLKESIRRFGFVGVVGYDDKGLMIGHARRQAALEMWADGETVMGPGKREPLPEGMIPAIDISGLSEAERRALIIADNQLALNAGWDEDILRAEIAALGELEFDLSTLGFDEAGLDRLINPPAGVGVGGGGPNMGGLATEFLIPPFSVLNAREGWWQDRKRAWISLGIESEVGRGENLLRMSDTMLEPDPKKRAQMIAEREAQVGQARDLTYGAISKEYEGGGGAFRQGMRGKGRVDTNATKTQSWVQQKIAEGDVSAGLAGNQSGTSIFDPVLCELIYRWFAPKGGRVLDPFAGGSVRGVVAAALGRQYVGIDLRPEQIEANEEQWAEIEALLPEALEGDRLTAPRWIAGDSNEVLSAAAEDDQAGEGFDLVFSCPPYGDLEVYSDDPADISTLPIAEFDIAYERIIARAIARLADDRFACFVVGDYRLKSGGGVYANFVAKTIAAFEAAGASLYNEAILVTAVGSLPIRMAKQFRSTRKLGKTHQNILVFVKGDPRKATEALGPVDVSAALDQIEPDDGPEGPDGAEKGPVARATPNSAALGPDQVKVSAAMARLEFIQCGPDCVAAGCLGNCCDSSSHAGGCFVTVQDDELGRIGPLAAQRGASIEHNLIVPKPGTRGCPFKTDGLCDLHQDGTKPWGCVASPFTLNGSGTLIVRNRYRLLPCFKNEGPKSPAYRVYRSSLVQIFGEAEAGRIEAHLDGGGGDLIAQIDPANKARLMRNDAIRKADKLGGEI